MRKRLLAATALTTTILFLVPGAFAQGTVDWSGPYVGAGVGVVINNSAVDLSFDDPDNDGLPTFQALYGLGASGTVTAGFNLQDGNLVYGLQADGSLLSLSSTGTSSDGSASYDINERLTSLFSLRGRLGLASGPLLYYATAGIAAGHVDFTANIFDGGPGVASPATASGIVFGPTAGIGVEYALNDTVSLNTEGVVTSLGPLTATGDPGKGSFTASNRSNTLSLRSGVNVHF